jgi:hypothetical protein
MYFIFVSRDSSFGIAAPYGLDGLGSNTGRGENFRIHPNRSWSPYSPAIQLVSGLFPDKAAGVWPNHPPHLGPSLRKEQSYTYTPLPGLRGLFFYEVYFHFYPHNSDSDPRIFSTKQITQNTFIF